MTLALRDLYEELSRNCFVLTDDGYEPEFVRLVLYFLSKTSEITRLQQENGSLMKEIRESNLVTTDLERKLHRAREMVDKEKRKCRDAESRLDDLESQLALVRDLLFDGRSKQQVNEETWQRLQSVCSRPSPHASSFASTSKRNSGLRESMGKVAGWELEAGLSRISECMDSTGSLLSELGYTHSEDELEETCKKERKMAYSGKPVNENKMPDSKSSSSHTRVTSAQPGHEVKTMEVEGTNCVVATTTVRVLKDGPVVANSKLEAISSLGNRKGFSTSNITSRHPLSTVQPTAGKNEKSPTEAPPSVSESEESLICTTEDLCPNPRPCNSGLNLMAHDRLNAWRGHTFSQKTMLVSEPCGLCGNRIRFGKLAAKCRDCRATVHSDCKDRLPRPCVPVNITPTARGRVGALSDFTPSEPPMIPALLVHCIREVEARGFTEIGLYRISGSERDVKNLKEKFLRGRGAPNMSEIDVYVICGVIKDFLRSLREPLVMTSMWGDFIRCVESVEEHNQQARLYQVVAELPRPNRDTLSYLILHLQRLSQCPACKMPASSLAKIFGPTVVGYSAPNLNPVTMMQETVKQVAVVELMMKAPSSYWSCFVNAGSLENQRTPEGAGTQTRNPSSSSLHKTGFFSTPQGTARFRTKQRFFKPY